MIKTRQQAFIDWIDNPIFVKHVRSRLRRQPLAASAVVVVVLCLCIVWSGYQLEAFNNGRAFEWLVVLQAIILIIMGASQVGSSVGGARGSGILDFHRVSPLTPTELTLGFFFGAPVREYALIVCTLPFVLLFMAFGVPTVHGFVQIMILLVAIAWLFHGLSLLSALIMKPQRGARGTVGVIVVIVMVFFNTLRGGRVIPSAALFDENGRLDFFGYSLPWLAVVLLYLGSTLYFVYLAGLRKMGSERIHPLSKWQSIAALSCLSVLVLGGIWHKESDHVLEVTALYSLVVTAVLLILMVTPSQAEYVKGLWRARKQGRGQLAWWDDLSLNRVFLLVATAIVLLTGTLAWNVVGTSSAQGFAANSTSGNFPLAVAVGVLVVAYFGLAHQYFSLRFGVRGKTYFGLFLFLAWLLPLVTGTILAMSAGPMRSDAQGQMIFSLSPIPGIAMVAAPTYDESYRRAIQGAAITPPLLFVFMFNSLLVSARRRAYKDFQSASGNVPPGELARPVIDGEATRIDSSSPVAKAEVTP